MALAVALVILVVLRVAKLRVARLLALPTMGGGSGSYPSARARGVAPPNQGVMNSR